MSTLKEADCFASHRFEYYGHGMLSLYAAFNTKTGEVLGKTAARHTSTEFVAFLTDIVINQPRGTEIHVFADNLSAHKSAPVKDFLAAHPKVYLHCSPTYSSWLNQVELWFAKIERDTIARGVLTSVADLMRKLQRNLIGCRTNAVEEQLDPYRLDRRQVGPDLVIAAHESNAGPCETPATPFNVR